MSLQKEVIARSFDNRALHLIIMPTERCNLRCTYCYEDFKIGQMPEHVSDGIISLLIHRAPELQKLEIAWFGGEPLLGLSVIRKISAAALELVKQHPQLIYTSVISTNAIKLNQGLFDELVDLGITTYQISMDGDKDNHNSSRIFPNGKGTYDIIWSNLIQIKKSTRNFQIALRIHLTRDNLLGVQSLLGNIHENFGSDSRFKIYFKAVEALGGPNDATLPFLDGNTKSKTIENFKKITTEKALLSDENVIQKICYAAQGNSFVVRADGRIGKCTVALNDEKNCIGNINRDGTLSLDQKLFRTWVTRTLEGDEDFARCPLPFI